MNLRSIDRDRIIESNPIIDYLERKGHKFKRAGSEFITTCPLHEDKHPSFSVNPQKNLWKCHAGCGGGSIIDLYSRIEGISIKESMQVLENGSQSIDNDKKREIATYQYRDALGKPIFEVVRYHPKDFKQRKINPDGSKSWGISGVERVIYKLPEVLDCQEPIVICEGEKDVENLNSIGVTATCNPGGAGKWLPTYSQWLKDKQIVIIPDNDEPGMNHAKQVLALLEGKVKWVKWVEIPKPHKDASDYIKSFSTLADAAKDFYQLYSKGRLIPRGVDSDILSSDELRYHYIKNAADPNKHGLNFDNILPSLKLPRVRAGELLGIMGGTASCKTALLQNIIVANYDITSLVFELELSPLLFFERNLAIATGIDQFDIHVSQKAGRSIGCNGKLNNCFSCHTAGLSIESIDQRIERSAAKIGKLPDIFAIDYIQLMRGKGDGRTERTSDAAEGTRIICNKYGIAGIMLSQVNRAKGEARDSSSIENSVSILLGTTKVDNRTIKVKVLKNTRGEAGQEVTLDLCGGNLRLRERNGRP